MRYLFSLVLSLTIVQFAIAGNNGGCGAGHPPVWQSYLSVEERLNPSLLDDGSRGGMRWMPIYYHLVARSDGSGSASLKDVFISHCELNEEYNKFNMAFFIAGIDTPKNTALYEYVTMDNNDAFPLYNKPNKCNVYINGEMPGLCGVATFPGWASNGGGVFVRGICHGEGSTTLKHELGHYFRLLHTFETWQGTEFVDGSNCATAGDGYCDTPADFIDYRAACPYTGTQVDGHGDPYAPVLDESLYMSYFNDECQYKFSTEERAEMNACLTNDRSYLLNQTLPDVSALDSVTYITPQPGDTSLNSSSVVFKWHSVPRAMYYIFKLMPNSSSIVIVDTLIKDTTFSVGNLATNKIYKFRVTPVSYGNTCGEMSHFLTAQTSPIKATPAVLKPSCPGDANGTASVTASNGLFPYTYLWSNGQTTASATGLSAGSYTVTITDSNGEIVVSTIVVTDPPVLYATIDRVGNNLNAYGAGGTAPYSYSWSNGTVGQYNNNVPFGSYTVTVTDSKGCTTTESFIISSVGVKVEPKVSMRVFPNPAERTSSINLQIDLNQNTEATVQLVNVNGQVLQSCKRSFVSGTNNLTMPVDGLSSGIYLVEFTSAGFTKTIRLSVIR